MKTQGVEKALAITTAVGCGPDIPVVPGEDESSLFLAEFPNVVSEYLVPKGHLSVSLPKSSTGLQKAALLTFQTWKGRAASTIEGLLLGTMNKGRLNCHRLLVADRVHQIWNSPKLVTVRETEKLVPLGIVLSGLDTDQKILEIRSSWFQKLAEADNSQEYLCVLVSRLCMIMICGRYMNLSL